MAELQLGVPPNQERSYTVEETDTQGILYTARYTIEEKGRPPLLVIKKRSLVANPPGQGGRPPRLRSSRTLSFTSLFTLADATLERRYQGAFFFYLTERLTYSLDLITSRVHYLLNFLYTLTMIYRGREESKGLCTMTLVE